jgi:hypothetical protein
VIGKLKGQRQFIDVDLPILGDWEPPVPQSEIVLVGVYPGKIYRSTDSGVTWDDGHTLGDSVYSFLDYGGGVVFAGGEKKVFKSIDYGETWDSGTQIDGDRTINDIKAFADGTLVASHTGNDGYYSTVIAYSTNQGVNWSLGSQDPSITLAGARSLVVSGSVSAFAVCGNSTLLASIRETSDKGESWTEFQAPSYYVRGRGVFPNTLVKSGSAYLLGTDGTWSEPETLHRSADGMNTWTAISLEDDWTIERLFTFSAGRVIASASGGYYRSMDEGATWGSFIPTNDYYAPYFIETSNGVLLMGHPNGVARSDDFGETWSDFVSLGGYFTGPFALVSQED